MSMGGMGWAGIAQSGFDTAMQGALDAARMKAGYKYAKKLAVHRYPWMVESLQRAGLNPLLAVGGAQPGQSALQLASGPAGKSNLVDSFRTSALLRGQQDLLEAQAESARSTARNQDALALLAGTRNAAELAELPRKQIQEELTSELLGLVRDAKGFIKDPEKFRELFGFLRGAAESGSSSAKSYVEGVKEKLKGNFPKDAYPYYWDPVLEKMVPRPRDERR